MTLSRDAINDAPGILAEITRIQQERGRPPTVRELADACRVSATTMQLRLEMLASRGYVEWQPGKARTLRVVPPEQRE